MAASGLKTIVAGSRTITSFETVADAIESAPFEIESIVSGCADGVDTLGEQWAEQNDVPINRHPYEDYRSMADERGMPAPLVRNEAMAECAEALVAVWDGESSGTEHMLQQARNEGLEVHLVRTDTRRLDDFTG